MEQSKNKRARRTRAELEADVFDAIRQLASEKGLAQITFTDIMQRADIQMSVLLNNYKNIERLLDKYAYISDYWLPYRQSQRGHHEKHLKGFGKLLI